MTLPRPAGALALLLLAACAAPSRSLRGPDLALFELQARLSARGASFVGEKGGFAAAGERFGADCTGFVQAVYAAEGVPLRRLMEAAAPGERSGVAAALRAMERYGVVFAGGEPPAPGDLVFWHGTWDRNGNGDADDRLTHVGLVEYVVDGTVVFLHRGSRDVARGVMTLDRPDARAANGLLANTPIRTPGARPRGAPVLAGELFAAFGRIDPAKLPPLRVAAR